LSYFRTERGGKNELMMT